MRHLPTKFTLMGRDYTVGPLSPADCETMDGQHSWADASIEINLALSKQHQMATFGHEVMHALLEAAGREDLSSDEKLVDVMGNLLHQFLKTRRGRLQ